MKLRLYRDSIRFRLSPTDVATLEQRGRICETTHFAPGAMFTYCIELSPDATHTRAGFSKGALTVVIPTAHALDWARSDLVGIHHLQLIRDDRSLSILIEKDFECLDASDGEPAELMYPNPKSACS